MSGSVVMTDCSISDCTAEYGAGIHVAAPASLELNTSTVFDNVATVEGGGLYVEAGGLATLNGSVVCGNAPEQIVGTVTQDEASCESDLCALYDGGATTCDLAEPCPGDLNGDDVVDGQDLAAVLAAWGQDVPDLDQNADGTIDGQDLAAVLAAWGMPCGQ